MFVVYVSPRIMSGVIFRLHIWLHRIAFFFENLRFKFAFVYRSSVCRWLFTFLTFCIQPLNGIWRDLTKQVLNVLHKVYVFGPLRSVTEDGRHGLWFAETFLASSATDEWNFTKLDIKQVLNILCQVCVFRADPSTNEPLHEKTYNLDWRHNPLKRRHEVAGENHVDVCGVLSVLIIINFSFM